MSTPNVNDALAAHRRLTNLHGASDDSRLVYTFLSSLPPPPFVLPPPGTEFVVKVLANVRHFYRLQSGQVIEVYRPRDSVGGYSEQWFREHGAEIVEGQP